MTSKLDETDVKILRILRKNARITTKEIAARVNLSTTPVFERIKRLESEGYIERYTAILNPEKLDMGFIVFCCVKLKRMSRDIAVEFVEKVKTIPEVSECYNISGEFDYLLKINAPDMKYYNKFLLDVLGSIESLGSVQSIFAMKEIKQNYGISL
ncbi:Lrp/AsnC family transcriptional regulator, leucine-responsive regulatory protein [Bacteroidales bacterium WCE2008]|nr:Lrp/AsnC family transcriptional regulator, leucine-responsive regulatory protein [Bacteroidales bacterium WCE2008]